MRKKGKARGDLAKLTECNDYEGERKQSSKESPRRQLFLYLEMDGSIAWLITAELYEDAKRSDYKIALAQEDQNF